MSVFQLMSLTLIALSILASPAYSADTGEVTVNGNVITWLPDGGGANSTGRLSLSFTRSDGQAAFNPGRVTLFGADGSKLFELNDLGSVIVYHQTLDVLGQHWEFNIATVSTHFTVNGQSYLFGAWAIKHYLNGKSISSAASAFLNTEATYANPSGEQVWYASGNPIANVVVDP